MPIPKYDELYNPALQAFHNLGGSASCDELAEEVAKILKLSDQEASEIHRGNMTKLAYRLAWVRTYLGKYGLLENSSRGVWALTGDGLKVRQVDPKEVTRQVKAGLKSSDSSKPDGTPPDGPAADTSVETWQEQVVGLLLKLPPDAFERFSQRFLRECGFVQVEVTGRSGDEGIDGRGILRMGGVLSFHVVFQCKRYKGSVSSPVVRDFRGAMVGRADKGLIITTGTFTRDARREAQRDGAPPIDLIDGELLAERLKELGLGVDVIQVPRVSVRAEWFEGLKDKP